MRISVNPHNHLLCLFEAYTEEAMIRNYEYPLIAAIYFKNNEMVEELIKKTDDVNKPNKETNTPLIIAAEYGNAHIVELLLKAGAIANKANKEGLRPIDIAKIKNKYEDRTDIIELLRANVNRQTLKLTSPEEEQADDFDSEEEQADDFDWDYFIDNDNDSSDSADSSDNERREAFKPSKGGDDGGESGGKNALLAGIEQFKKEGLKKVPEQQSKSTGGGDGGNDGGKNALLAGIEQFKKEGLKKVPKQQSKPEITGGDLGALIDEKMKQRRHQISRPQDENASDSGWDSD